jgi:hypothetical protein
MAMMCLPDGQFSRLSQGDRLVELLKSAVFLESV